MDEFVYLYRRPATPPESPQEMQEMMGRWRAWFSDLEKSGRLAVYGQPLDPKEGKVARDAKGAASDGPYAETKDIVVGYSVVRATNINEAIELTKGHPIFDQGGVIEVRPVLKL